MDRNSGPENPESGVEHEPIVSETLEKNARPAGEGPEGAGEIASARLEDDENGPSKRHGDALEHGVGNRHGVHEADRRPDTCT